MALAAAALALVLAAWATGWVARAWDWGVAAYERRFLTQTRSEFLMGTYVTITAVGPGAGPAADAAMARMQEVDGRLNPSDPGSDIGRLALGAGTDVPVSSDTIAVLELADRAYRASGGAFDLTVGPLVTLWGFAPVDPTAVGGPADQQRTSPPTDEEIAAARAELGWDQVSWDGAAMTARLARPGMRLSTGGLGKGYAIDAAAEVLRQKGIRRAVIDAGGELLMVGSKAGGRPWRIAVKHPRQDGYLGVLNVPPDTAVATSGDYQRYFVFEGRRYHHIIDPATGRPAERSIASTVVAGSAAWADALSTAVFVLGPERGVALAESLPDVGALVVAPDGTVSESGRLTAIFEKETGAP